MYLGINRKSGYSQFLLWALALALLVSQTLAANHIHFHPESENETEVVTSSFTPAYVYILLAAAASETEEQHDDPPAEHDGSCELCLLSHISWLPTSDITPDSHAQIHDNPVAARHVFISSFFTRSFLARAPPLFS